MGTFTTKLKLGGPAFGVSGGLDPTINRLTVGLIRVTETLPNSRAFGDAPCYIEEYMCIETGVGSGQIWIYGKTIFATEEEAQAGVIARQQAAYKERAEHDARIAIQAEMQRQEDLRMLAVLKRKYESDSGIV